MKTGYLWVVAGVAFAWVSGQTASAAATNRYVVKDNPGALAPYDALTNAAADIQTAINYGYAGETVLVAAATYDTGGTNAGRYLTNRVYISKALTVRSVNNDPANTIIKGAWDPLTNGWLAVRCVYMVAGSSLIGFTLTNGATLTTNAVVDRDHIAQDACGGGVCAWGTASATVSNCIITGNSAWGDRFQSAKYGAGACDGTYFNCVFIGNTSGGHGAGADSAVMWNCMIVGNTALGNGGGSHRGTLYNCLVSNNAAFSGGGVAGWGPAAPCRAYNCTIVNNRSTSHGGGAGCQLAGGNILSNCTVAFNTASGVGGGADSSILIGCSVVSNSSAGGGGAARSDLTNCIVAYNINGGVRYNTRVRNSLFYGNQGYGLAVRNGDLVQSCTLVGHTAGLQVDGASTVTVVNTISYSNTVNWVQVDTSVFKFTNSCTYPAVSGWDASNTTNNPQFVAYGSNFGTTHVPGNYRLSAGSPCINTGLLQTWMTGAVDLDGNKRVDPVSLLVDMGCYERVLPGGALIYVR